MQALRKAVAVYEKGVHTADGVSPKKGNARPEAGSRRLGVSSRVSHAFWREPEFTDPEKLVFVTRASLTDSPAPKGQPIEDARH